MGKFKVKFKLQGLELEIEGSREDVPLITESVGRQVAGMLGPAGNIVEGEIVLDDAPTPVIPTEPVNKSTRRRGPARRKGTAAGANGTGAAAEPQAVDWVHETSKWGSPQQSWVTAKKAIWLLYVAGQEAEVTSMSSKQIAVTFNKHFQQAKRIQTSKVTRDLGKLKTGKNSPVSENTTVDPPLWFLTQTGQTEAQKLVLEALGQSDGAGKKAEG